MPERVFQTARFKVHNPSRHKQTMLLNALQGYHRTAKRVLEKALADPALEDHCSLPNRNGSMHFTQGGIWRAVGGFSPQQWPA